MMDAARRTTIAGLMMLIVGAAARADLEPMADRVIAVRGGVLMTPLRGERPRGARTMSVRFQSGAAVEGRIVWLTQRRVDPPLHWTTDLRAVAVSDEPPPIGVPARAYLIAPLPADGAGPIEVNGTRLRGLWHERPADPPGDGIVLEIAHRDDRPDPASPLEHWRWVMLARRTGATPPGTERFDELTAAVAQHHADTWRVAMHRLRSASPSVEALCLQWLSAICTDRDHTVAAWITSPAATGTLLETLLDWRQDDTERIAAALEWSRSQDPLLMWLESSSTDDVALAMVNRGNTPVVTRFAWDDAGDIPVAVEVQPRTLIEAIIDREPQAASAGPLATHRTGPTATILRIVAGDRRYGLPTAPRSVIARPPGTFAHRLTPPLTLIGLQERLPLHTDDEHATFVHLRRVSRRWELFAECRRPSGIPPEQIAATADHELPIGREAITLLLGDTTARGGAEVTLIVPEDGWHELPLGGNDGSLQVYRRSLSDRWNCRIVLPDAWLDRGAGELTRLGVVRTHGDHDGFEIAPGATTTWRRRVGRSAVDLSAWDDLPGAAGAEAR